MTTRYLNGPAVDQVLAEETIDGGETQDVLYMLPDHQGSIRDVIDNSGAVQDHIFYDAYGRVLTESDDTVQHTYGFAGYYFDKVTRLNRSWSRWYDPPTGTWTGEDPVKDGTNWTIYVGASPTNFTDPSGLAVSLGDPPQQASPFAVPPGSLPTNPSAPAGGAYVPNGTGPVISGPLGIDPIPYDPFGGHGTQPSYTIEEFTAPDGSGRTLLRVRDACGNLIALDFIKESSGEILTKTWKDENGQRTQHVYDMWGEEYFWNDEHKTWVTDRTVIPVEPSSAETWIALFGTFFGAPIASAAGRAVAPLASKAASLAGRLGSKAAGKLGSLADDAGKLIGRLWNKADDCASVASRFAGKTNKEIIDAIGSQQRDLLRQWLGTGAKGARAARGQPLPEGLSADTLRAYQEIARRQIEGGLDTVGTQAERLRLIEEALRALGQ